MSALIPPAGEPATLVQRLRDYVTPHDSELFTRCEGATDEEIAAYAEAAGFPSVEAVPTSYRAFLRGMGVDDGGLLEMVDVTASIDDLLDYYERAGDYPALAPGLPIAAQNAIEGQLTFDLRAGSSADPALATAYDGLWHAVRARSWETFVMQTAVRYVEARRLPRAAYHGSSVNSAAAAGVYTPADTLARVAAFASAHGLASAWPSDERSGLFLGERHSVFAHTADGGSASLELFSADGEFLRAVARDLAPRLGASGAVALELLDGSLRQVHP